MKKVPLGFYPPEDVEKFYREVSRWSQAVSKRDRALGQWAGGIATDNDFISALRELVFWHKVVAKDLLDFLADLRIVYMPERELRARVRALGRKWKEIETRARRARKESEDLLGDYNQRARRD